MKDLQTRIVQNRKSPKNEDDYIRAYKQMNPSANRHDNYDIAAVRTKSGETGHALLKQDINRGHDKDFHYGKDFIPDKDLRKKM